MNLSKGVYLSGFARGGTTWARQILCAHPDVYEIPKQVGFRAAANQPFDEAHIKARIEGMMATIPEDQADLASLGKAKKFVVKAPPNALIMSEMMDLLPDAKHVFILRDPRDVLVSHQRTGVAWTEAHRNYDLAIDRTATFYKGYEKAKGRDNLILFRYEDVHQKFPSTFRTLCEFMDLDVTDEQVEFAMHDVSFRARTGRSHEERPGMNRRGVAGDWVKNLSYADGCRIQENPFWQKLMDEHGYHWNFNTINGMITSAAIGGANGRELTDDQPGLHMVWSLSDSFWDNMEAANGMFRRCRQAFQHCSDNAIPSTLMLAGALPPRLIKTVSRNLKDQHIFLEINLDAMSEKPSTLKAELAETIAETKPTLLALNGEDTPVRAIVFGESWGSYKIAMDVLQSHNIEAISLQKPTPGWKTPIAWMLADKSNAMTISGAPEGFDMMKSSSWETLKNTSVFAVAKITASSIGDPLSLGYRTCFGDLRTKL